MRLEADTLERLVPDELAASDVTGLDTLRIHVERYEFAARHARPGRLLDLACGAGYGTRLLADRVQRLTEAVGVDCADDAVRYARQTYGRPGVRFERCDALEYGDPQGFDTIVSLETIEHVADPGKLLEHLVGLLRPGGVLVASVPTTPSADVNPHHLHDFTERSFRRLIGVHPLLEVECLRQVQPYRLLAALTRSEARMREIRPGLVGYYAAHPLAAFRRVATTLRYGFANRYLTVACRLR